MVEDIEQIYKRTKQYGRTQFVEEIYKLQCEKQQLISFLEDKIRKKEEDKRKFPHLFSYWIGVLEAYEDVLDYVKVGAK